MNVEFIYSFIKTMGKSKNTKKKIENYARILKTQKKDSEKDIKKPIKNTFIKFIWYLVKKRNILLKNSIKFELTIYLISDLYLIIIIFSPSLLLNLIILIYIILIGIYNFYKEIFLFSQKYFFYNIEVFFTNRQYSNNTLSNIVLYIKGFLTSIYNYLIIVSFIWFLVYVTYVYLYLGIIFNIDKDIYDLFGIHKLLIFISFLMIIKNFKLIWNSKIFNIFNFLVILMLGSIINNYNIHIFSTIFMYLGSFYFGASVLYFFYYLVKLDKEKENEKTYLINFFDKAFITAIRKYEEIKNKNQEKKQSYEIIYDLFVEVLKKYPKGDEIKLNIDQPIQSQYQDKDILGHKEYVKNLFDLIYAFDMSGIKGSYSIGIVGEWGIGKSGIVNMLHNDWIKSRNDMIFYEFNPWNFEKNDLIVNFFNDLGKELEISSILSSFKQYVSIIGNIDAIKGYSFIKDILGFILPDKSIYDIKEEINKKLEKHNKKIIISIDDLDRCTPEEIMMMLNIIKNLGNFKNIIYIVSYDKDNVLNVLKDKKFGDNYLDKIVNYEIYVKYATKNELGNFFKENIENIFSSIVFINSFEKNIIDKVKLHIYDNIFNRILIKENLRFHKKFYNSFSLELQNIINVTGDINKSNLQDFLEIVFILDYYKLKNYKFYTYFLTNILSIISEIDHLNFARSIVIRAIQGIGQTQQEKDEDEYKYTNDFLMENYYNHKHLFNLFGLEFKSDKKSFIFQKPKHIELLKEIMYKI